VFERDGLILTLRAKATRTGPHDRPDPILEEFAVEVIQYQRSTYVKRSDDASERAIGVLSSRASRRGNA